MQRLPQVGEVKWIGVRPGKRAAVNVLSRVEADAGQGLVGDRYAGRSGERQVTLIQWEHLPVIASLCGGIDVRPEMLRRNVAVAGINLLALRNRRFTIGEAELEYTGTCDPCSFMEQTLGPGGYNAMRGHGGITARVLQGGAIAMDDRVAVVNEEPDGA